MVRTSSDPTPERGELMRWLAALGLALMLIGIPVGLTAAAALTGPDRPAAGPATAVRQPAQASTPTTEPDGPASYSTVPPTTLEPVPEPTVEPSHRPKPKPGVPVRLVVPELGVDAPVVPISAPGGVLLPPSDPQMLGWWRDGARPGARHGGALITGHTVHTGGGAFDNLETLTRGDSVRVRTRRGTVAYVVTHVRIYRKSSLAQHAAEVFSQQVPGRLVLITCEGWNGAGYDSNAVVLARPI